MSDTSIVFPAVQAYGGNYDYKQIAANATNTLKSSQGLLHTVAVTKAGASANTITIYDNTAGSGTVIAVIDGTVVGTYTFDIEFGTGLTIVTAIGTAANLTVSYL